MPQLIVLVRELDYLSFYMIVWLTRISVIFQNGPLDMVQLLDKVDLKAKVGGTNYSFSYILVYSSSWVCKWIINNLFLVRTTCICTEDNFAQVEYTRVQRFMNIANMCDDQELHIIYTFFSTKFFTIFLYLVKVWLGIRKVPLKTG